MFVQLWDTSVYNSYSTICRVHLHTVHTTAVLVLSLKMDKRNSRAIITVHKQKDQQLLTLKALQKLKKTL